MAWVFGLGWLYLRGLAYWVYLLIGFIIKNCSLLGIAMTAKKNIVDIITTILIIAMIGNRTLHLF